jgi:hypothetical protein
MSFFSSLLRPPSSLPQPAPAAATTATAAPASQITDDPIMLWQSLKNDGYCILPGHIFKYLNDKQAY